MARLPPGVAVLTGDGASRRQGECEAFQPPRCAIRREIDVLCGEAHSLPRQRAALKGRQAPSQPLTSVLHTPAMRCCWVMMYPGTPHRDRAEPDAVLLLGLQNCELNRPVFFTDCSASNSCVAAAEASECTLQGFLYLIVKL